ncbi:hypothetical protein, partial [Caulobacter sp. CCH5-E12]|uniref:hypothetical protein n=1 Tax=Caulobacter sp. CCH5-E12 TaxID=1768770 RepID=UPI001E29977B
MTPFEEGAGPESDDRAPGPPKDFGQSQDKRLDKPAKPRRVSSAANRAAARGAVERPIRTIYS